MLLAPQLLELEATVEELCSNRDPSESDLLEVFGRTRSFLMESISLFREVEETLLLDDEGLQKMQLCSQEMSHSLAALNKLEEAAVGKKMFILRDRLNSFLLSRTRCTEYFGEFSRLAAEQPIYSPVPSFDSFIKAGVKVLQSQLDKHRLENRFPSIIPDLQRAQRMVGLLPKLHQPDPQLMAGLRQGLQGLETGFGAINQYFQQDDKVALEDGLKLIGSSSSVLGLQFEKAEESTSKEKRYTSFRPLEEWLRLKNYLIANPFDGEIPDSWLFANVSQIFSVWDYLLQQAQQLMQNPMLKDVELQEPITPALLEESIQARNSANIEFATLSKEALLKTEDARWMSYVPNLERMKEAVEKSYQALEQTLAPFRELPGLEQVALLKERVKSREAPKSALATELQNQLIKVEELIKSVEDAGDPVSREFRDLVPIHRAAFMGMLENLNDDDWDALDSRWQSVLETLPHLAAISRSLKKRMAMVSSSARLIKCLRCEADNEPTRRVCSSCGATLPAVVQQMQTFTEIDTSQDGENPAQSTISPRAIELLEALVRGLEGNQTSKADAADGLRLMLEDVNRQRQLFSKKLLPMMGKDKALDSYLNFFAQGLGSYFAALTDMRAAVVNGSLPQIHSALTQCRETLEVMDAMKERIDGALRG